MDLFRNLIVYFAKIHQVQKKENVYFKNNVDKIKSGIFKVKIVYVHKILINTYKFVENVPKVLK